MREIIGDIWSIWKKPLNILCITTNSEIWNAMNIMGAGIAKEAKLRFPDLPRLMAAAIVIKGNPYYLIELPQQLIALQTKYNWRDPSPLDLVEESIKRLGKLASENKTWIYHTAKPGCGFGGLSFHKQVKPLLNKYCGDNVMVWDTK